MFKIFVFCSCLALAAALSPASLRSVAHSGDEAHAEVELLKSDVRADGFDWALETSNGIHAQAAGDAYGNIHGDYAYTSPEGVPVKLSYVADENGYQPNSDLLPVGPPIPVAILKALEYIRTHPPHEDAATYGRKG